MGYRVGGKRRAMWELFKDLKGLESRYKVGTFGNIWSKARKKFLSACDDGNGYLIVCVQTPIGQRTLKVHKLVARTFLKEDKTRVAINHLDSNKYNNSLGNLERATPTENRLHAYKNNKGYAEKFRGENNKFSKLTEEEVKQIRGIKNYSNLQIAKFYNVSKSAIQAIRSGRTWK